VPTQPPGRTTRAISAAALRGSDKNVITRAMAATSKQSSPKGSACASPMRKSAALAPGRLRAKAS